MAMTPTEREDTARAAYCRRGQPDDDTIFTGQDLYDGWIIVQDGIFR